MIALWTSSVDCRSLAILLLDLPALVHLGRVELHRVRRLHVREPLDRHLELARQAKDVAVVGQCGQKGAAARAKRRVTSREIHGHVISDVVFAVACTQEGTFLGISDRAGDAGWRGRSCGPGCRLG